MQTARGVLRMKLVQAKIRKPTAAVMGGIITLIGLLVILVS